MSSLTGKHVLILGLGESGLAMARWCAMRGARVRVADSRREPPGRMQLLSDAPLAEVICGDYGVDVLDGVDLLLLSPGIDPQHAVVEAARQRGLPLSGEIGLFVHALDELGVRERCRIIAITGTNGKTTTTALVAALAASAGIDAVAAGNISPTTLDVLMQRLEVGAALPSCWVLELSSFQLETAPQLGADAACVLNVSPDHLDRHRSLAAYAACKAGIFHGGGVQVLNRDDEMVTAMAAGGRRIIRFGAGQPQTANDYGLRSDGAETWLMRGEEQIVPGRELGLSGRHNLLNALAALALCESALDLSAADLGAGLRAFRSLPHRVELVGEREADGVRFFNDSKATNVAATAAAVEGFREPLVLIAGGEGKGQDFAPLARAVAGRVRALQLIGRDADLIAAALADSGVRIEHAPDLDAAVQRAAELAQAGDVVLLSPACASLDMFRNYVQRGAQFAAAVRRQPGVEAR